MTTVTTIIAYFSKQMSMQMSMQMPARSRELSALAMVVI